MQTIYNTPAEWPRPCVATIGFFDGVHRGHRFLIDQVKEVAAAKGVCSALITFPVHPRKVMNADYRPELLTTRDEKLALLAETGVDYCMMLDFTQEVSQLTARQFMADILKKQYNVQTLVIGYDHRFGHNRSEGFEDYCRYGSEMGMEIVLARACTYGDMQISSSVIRDFLHKGDVEMASRCLGYDYFLEGIVVSGHQVGRTIGFPTANLKVDDPDKLVPAYGVYAVYVTLEGKRYKGMLSIGVRPTIGNGTDRSIEVNILHFNSDIYSKPLRLTFVKYLRPELKYDTIEELVEQLHRDEADTEAILS